MLKEILWYIEPGRYSGITKELGGALRSYAEGKANGAEESRLCPLREDARLLFESHSERCGIGRGFINIDSEFFDGAELDEAASGGYIKRIISGYGRQRVLWTYMGTTGAMTAVSKTAMADRGQRYEDLLPAECKESGKKHKPPYIGKGEPLVYMYADGKASSEYDHERAKLRFDRLECSSGLDWEKGYDPNGSVKKDGWHGTYDHTGTWVKSEGDAPATPLPTVGMMPAAIELIRTDDGIILNDPDLLLLSPPLIVYATELGEPYGNLELDRAKTLAAIAKALEAMRMPAVTAVATREPLNKEKLAAYKETLGSLASPVLEASRTGEAQSAKAAVTAEAEAVAAETAGVGLGRRLALATAAGMTGSEAVASVAGGKAAMPLSVRNKGDHAALGLSAGEAEELCAIHVSQENEAAFDAALCNLYAAWPLYEGGAGKAETASLVAEYLESGKPASVGEPVTLAGQTTIGGILEGGSAYDSGSARMHSSGIPGVFAEPEPVDFYDTEATSKHLKALERRRVLPKSGAAAALAALKDMPQAEAGQKAAFNRSLTRALGHYKAVSVSTGLPIAELVGLAAAHAGIGKPADTSVLGKKVFFEVPVGELVEEAGKGNMQKREVRLADEDPAVPSPGVVTIGGVQGTALSSAWLPKEKLEREYGLSAKEASKAEAFFSHAKITDEEGEMPAFLSAALHADKPATAAAFKRSALKALEAHDAVAYNMASDEGIGAFYESGGSGAKSIAPAEIRELLAQAAPVAPIPPASAYAKLDPVYMAAPSAAVRTRRLSAKGAQGKARLAGACSSDAEAAALLTAVAAATSSSSTDGTLSSVLPMSSAAADMGAEPFEGRTSSAPVAAGKAAGMPGGGVRTAPLALASANTATGSALFTAAEPNALDAAALHGGGDTASLAARSPAGAVAGESLLVPAASGNPAAANIYYGHPVLAASSAELPYAASKPAALLAGRSISSVAASDAPFTEPTVATPPLSKLHAGGAPASMPQAGTEDVSAPPAQKAASAEFERLRKVEANFKNDKADLAKQKQPALARSETHDVGHAGGSGERSGISVKSIPLATDMVLQMIRQSLRGKFNSSGKPRR